MKICKKCAHCNADEAKFCVKCGERLTEQQMTQSQIEIETLQCVKCGYNNKKGVKFCGNCGNEFVPDQKNNMNKKNKNYRWIILLFIMIISAIVAVFNWDDIEDVFEKEYYFTVASQHSKELDIKGDTISFSISTNADWVNKDNISVSLIECYWQKYSNGGYYGQEDLQGGYRMADDDMLEPIYAVKFIDDKHLEVIVDRNRGYNRRFQIAVWPTYRPRQQNIDSGYRSTFYFYQKGYEGAYSYSY